MADFEALLVKTSRTFALAIPLLPERCRHEVTLAYLLFRIADTFEDAAVWPRSERVSALADFAALLKDRSPERAAALSAQWVARRPIEHAGYMELLAETPAVIAATDALDEGARAIVIRHALRTTEGMAEVVERTDERGNLRLRDVDDLRAYCYIVAGIVGELLTELFIHHAPSLQSVAPALNADAVAFGEALQLVNILKDANDDADEGRVFLPAMSERAPVFELARADLLAARRYVSALQMGGAPSGFLAFTALPVLLARATLDRVETVGPGAKIERHEVMGFLNQLSRDLDRGAPALPAWE